MTGMNKRTLPRLETTRRAVVLIAVLGLLAAVSLASLPSAPRVNDPYGDVNGDGLVNSADINLLRTYLTNPSVLSTERKDRIRRFGDINNIVNRTTIGNGILDSHDVVRHALMAGGIIDAGTAGVARADYGDVDGDGKVTLVDTVIIQRSLSGFKNPAYETKVRSKGLGDISPTIPYVSFGDKAITDADFQQLQARAAGSEPNPPAYVDYWPAQCPNIEFTGVVADRYTFTDLNGITGDANHRVQFLTQSVEERRGYTVTRIDGDDGSTIGVFKGIDGSVYAMYMRNPLFYGNRMIHFQSPVKMIDADAARGLKTTWGGATIGMPDNLPSQRLVFKGTVLSIGNIYTPASGSYPNGTPPSTWSKALQIRLDVMFYKAPGVPFDSQQALFFDFAPFIGVIGRGQASFAGSATPEPNKPGLRLDKVIVRGITYDSTHP